MILHLVIDRRRLCPACGSDTGRAAACVLAQVRHAIDAEVDVVQVRAPELSDRDLAAIVSDVVAATRGTASRVVVNDRLDVALACGADGLHLKGDSVPPGAVRAAVPAGFLVGQSVHSVGEAVAAAAHVDYLIAGTVWPSESKAAGAPMLGSTGLKDIVRAVKTPVLAIGGVDLGRMKEVAATGAAGIAAIGLFLGAPGPERPCRAVFLTEIVKLARADFATSRYH